MSPFNSNISRVARYVALALLASLLLASCGGGGGSSASTTPPPSSTPVQQMGVVLVELSSAKNGVVTASWLPASEDPTIAPALIYELHMNTPAGDFVPSSQTLKFRGQAALSATVEGLQSGANYSVKLVVENASGQRITGDIQTIKVSDTTSALIPGVQVTVLNSQQVVAINDVANTLTLLAGTS